MLLRCCCTVFDETWGRSAMSVVEFPCSTRRVIVERHQLNF